MREAQFPRKIELGVYEVTAPLGCPLHYHDANSIVNEPKMDYLQTIASSASSTCGQQPTFPGAFCRNDAVSYRTFKD